MPLMSFPAAKAFGNLRRNPLARWPDGRRDGARLEGIVLPGHQAGFHLLTTDKVLTVGSCFARNIETRLSEMGFRVPALTLDLPERERGSDTANDMLNKYNPYSIVNEFLWAFEQPFPEDSYLELGPDEWHDPHLSANALPLPLARVRQRRKMVAELFKTLPLCRCVIVTLGLVEAWFDEKSALYLNSAPPAAAVRLEPDRFRLDVLGHEEVLAALQQLWALIQKHASHKVRMLLTVSPVPLKATYTNDDVLIANSYSKSVLRAAAGALAAAHAEVDYFPSYEAATLTARSTAFLEDNRHVAPELVDAVMDAVIRTYVPEAVTRDGASDEESVSDKSAAAQVRKHLAMDRTGPARRLLARLAHSAGYIEAGYTEFSFRYLYAKVLVSAGAPLEAEVELSRCVELQPDSALAHYALGRTLARLRRPLRAERAFRRAAELDPGNVDTLVRLARLELRNGKLVEAEQTGLAALAINSDHPEGRAVLAEIRAAAAGEWPAEDEPHADAGEYWPQRMLRLLRSAK